jgi:hypothetical protein
MAGLAAIVSTSLFLSAAATTQNAVPAGSHNAVQGIKVVGRWVINVRNPDGSLAATHEFHNALTPEGAATIAQVLARQRVFGDWVIRLWGESGNSPCSVGDSPAPCHIVKTTHPNAAGSNYFTTLAGPVHVDVNSSTFVVTLAGSATVQRSGVLDSAGTQVGTCGNNTTPPACPGVNDVTQDMDFTITALDQMIALDEGQIVDVTVNIEYEAGFISTSGKQAFADVLVGNRVAGGWRIVVAGRDGLYLLVVESTDPWAATHSATLTVESLQNELVLRGSGTADQDDNEVEVFDTRLATCGNNTTPAACPGMNAPQDFHELFANMFSAKALRAGQSIQASCTVRLPG